MEESINQVLEQNRRIIEQNRHLQEQLDNMNERMETLEQQMAFTQAVAIINHRNSSAEALFDEEDGAEASQTIQNWKQKESQSLIQLIDLGRTKYI